jgi:hypothetical protein
MKNKKHPLHFIKPGFSFKKGGAVPCHKCMKSRQEGGSNVITSSMGQWAYPGQVTRIPSNQITMKGVNYPVLGVDNTGYKQMMMPGGEYAYPGTSVTEYPMMQKGGPTVWTVPANETSHYDPLGDIVYMSEKDKYNPMVYPHEMYHRSQFLSGMGSIPGFWNGPLRKPQTPSVDPEDLGQLYYNRRALDQDILTNDFLNAYPEFQFVSPEVVYNRAINPDMYDTPWTLEGEADNYSNQFAGPMYYEKRGGRVKAQIGKFIPPPGYDRGVQRNDATTVNRTVIDPREVAKAKQEALEARRKQIASGRGKESFFGLFDIPVDYSGIERQNAPTIAQKKLAAEKAQGKVYTNLLEAASMAAGPAFNIYKSVGAPSRAISYLTGSPEVLTADELADEKFMEGLMGDFGGEEEFFKMYDRMMEQKKAEKAVLPLRRLAESGKFNPELNAMTKGQLPVSKGLASDLIGDMRYPEALKYPGSEVREMMPVSGVDLWRQYYMPHKMGGSIKKSRKPKR